MQRNLFRLENLVRLLAGACLLASAPLLFFAVVWLVFNLMVAGQYFNGLSAPGTRSFHEDVYRHFTFTLLNTADCIGVIVVAGFAPLIVVRPASRTAVAIWLAAVCATAGYLLLIRYESPFLAEAPASTIALFWTLPASIGAVAAVGAVLSAFLARRSA
jgi:hypothetical protein